MDQESHFLRQSCNKCTCNQLIKDRLDATKQWHSERATEGDAILGTTHAIVSFCDPRLATGAAKSRQRCTESVVLQIPRPQNSMIVCDVRDDSNCHGCQIRWRLWNAPRQSISCKTIDSVLQYASVHSFYLEKPTGSTLYCTVLHSLFRSFWSSL